MKKMGPLYSITVPVKAVSGDEYERFLESLAKIAGGFTATSATGGWASKAKSGALLVEDVWVVTVQAEHADYIAQAQIEAAIKGFARKLLANGEEAVLRTDRQGTWLQEPGDK